MHACLVLPSIHAWYTPHCPLYTLPALPTRTAMLFSRLPAHVAWRGPPLVQLHPACTTPGFAHPAIVIARALDGRNAGCSTRAASTARPSAPTPAPRGSCSLPTSQTRSSLTPSYTLRRCCRRLAATLATLLPRTAGRPCCSATRPHRPRSLRSSVTRCCLGKHPGGTRTVSCRHAFRAPGTCRPRSLSTFPLSTFRQF